MDVYGTSVIESQAILKKYAKDIDELSKFMSMNLKDNPSKAEEKRVVEVWNTIRNLKAEIKEKYHFLYVNFSTVIYFDNITNYFTTIDVVRADNPDRLYFISNKNKKKSPRQTPLKQDLIEAMIQFNKLEIELLNNKSLTSSRKNCLVYHCSPGFNHPNLHHYLKLFHNGVITQKKLILETLKNDSDIERRAAAVFLVGHFSDANEIISTLLPYVSDKEQWVRNNAMLMIVTAMELAKIDNIDTNFFHDFLNSPYTTDRNKALSILSMAANSPVSKRAIIQNDGEKILELLQLRQPNNHNLAYMILKKISGKDFGEYNISAWRNWLSQTKMKSIEHAILSNT